MIQCLNLRKTMGFVEKRTNSYYDYSNSYYYENGDYNSYYSIASDGSFVYYSDEFIGADGLIRETAG